jgi:hypothetical protein
MESNRLETLAADTVAAPSMRPPRRAGRIEELQAQIDKLRGRLRLAVVYGGDKSKPGAVINQTFNSRSWKSYESVAQDIADSLVRLGFRHVTLVPEDMRLIEFLKREGIHMAWLNTGGVQGYNPMCHVASMLEMCGLPYLGHGPLTASTLDNKAASRFSNRALRNLAPRARAVSAEDEQPFHSNLQGLLGALHRQAGVRTCLAARASRRG